ncbi:MAG: tRNA lysidine(34) synthetase TilS [Bacteroidia bacterium]|nr:tRNA lysidine(34) synthetase TilS [Bacteroidia bacterium]
MLQKLKTFIKEHQLIDNSDQIALAISGGKDSVFAAHLLNDRKQSFVLVHCNFNLRGDESNADEHFVSNLSTQLDFCNGIFIKQFDTETFAHEQKLTIQEAARKLRYAYFDELKNQGVYNKLITAHHLTDSLETFFINLYRVSGIKGLRGIPKERDYIIRPFLAFTTDEILEHLTSKNILYRTDSSNSELKYLRNKIRLNVLPHLEENLPDFSKNAIRSIANLESEYELLQFFLDREASLITNNQPNTNCIEIDKKSILSYPQSGVLLYYILDKYGFNHSQCQQIVDVCREESGKIFYSSTHQVLIDRVLILVQELPSKYVEETLIFGEGSYSFYAHKLTLERIEKAVFNNNPKEECVELPEDVFPLEIRTWREGDRFKPLGMKGTKLLSDFFIDEKIDVFSKHKIPLLCKKDKVLWVSKTRISEDIKVQSRRNIYRLSISNID